MIMIWMLLTILISVAFFTLVERKLLSIIQLRKGPIKVGFMGVLQPFADAIKLFFKDTNNLMKSNFKLYIFIPILALVLSMIFFSMKFLFFGFIFTMNIFVLLLLYSLGVYIPLILGWVSNSKYSLIGSMRSITQSISYEITLGMIFFFISILCSSFCMMKMMKLNSSFFSLNFSFIILLFLIINLMIESNRSPFDLSEGESELVSGFNVEYGGIEFSLIFLSENSMLIFNSILISIMFMNPFWISINSLLIMIIIINSRGSYPRFRFDFLMLLCWMIFIPLIFYYLIFMWIFF